MLLWRKIGQLTARQDNLSAMVLLEALERGRRIPSGIVRDVVGKIDSLGALL